ncbi:LamB/YcsF family protein [Thermoanaerobacterium thermosaccharolyticum]|uniref:LamB/YcsF family protein n=1 Tax=Thermoanaerobacterium thermosaccharolyticum TaxID=1517 RepID=UPI00178026F3|nr:5-oxoprolinase subunit PxpA [Thermoanaerobacterium thermosaccharolyticum]MBE0069640.1 LamB/YcsF family protein [Thermoanaerobacterium thermosaccharolyticum]MBE0229320.1 LamB/YcsF family protein [Thermoanaerobacterium thermosaccharolyticum]
MKYQVDINSDIGESFGVYKIGMDDEIVKYISSANIACGFHAGDPVVMANTVAKCSENGVGVGAHPGFPDLLGFGRRNMDVSLTDVKNYIIYQIGALQAFATSFGIKLQHVKTHGALYNMAAVDEKLAIAIAEAIASVNENFICVGMANTATQMAAEKVGLRFACEVFADRNINPDGTLVSRKLPNAIIHDEELACRRVLRMIKEGVCEAIDGSLVKIKVDTICVHGDNPQAVEFTKRIKKTLEENGVEIISISKFL